MALVSELNLELMAWVSELNLDSTALDSDFNLELMAWGSELFMFMLTSKNTPCTKAITYVYIYSTFYECTVYKCSQMGPV